MTVDRDWAINCLRHNRNSFLLNLASATLLKSDATLALEGRAIVVKPNEVIFNADIADRSGRRYEFLLDQLVDAYQHDQVNFHHDIAEFLLRARRNLVKESFEVVKAYASSDSRLEELKIERWYPYARVIRNCISHDMHFDFKPYDLSVLPVAYEGVTIDSSVQGMAMQQDHLPFFVAVEMLSEMNAFLES